MPIAIILHSLLILISLISTYIWTKTPNLNYYNLQISGLIIIFYFIGRQGAKKLPRLILYLDATILSCLALLVVLSTGSAHSPFFFLLYFLIFAISLLFEPLQSLLVTFTLLLIFTIDSWTNLDNLVLINLAALILITPLATILGKKYLETLENLGRIQILKKIIIQEETDSLFWLSTQAKPFLSNTITALGDLLTSLNSSAETKPVSANILERLKRIQTNLVVLYKSTDTLEDVLKATEDESTNP